MGLNFNKIFFLLFILNIPNYLYAGDLLLGKEKATTACSGCHGMDGQATSGGNSSLTPNITAQEKEYILAKLKDYKSGKINHPQMTLIAQMLSDKDIENVAEWYSNIKISIELPLE
jgi:cytochrome c553